MFEDDLWDFTAVIGLPNQMSKVSRRFGFTAIANVGWRLVAREQIMAMLAPRHEAVMLLPRAYRTPLHLLTASGRLAELTRFLNWLTGRGQRVAADAGRRPLSGGHAWPARDRTAPAGQGRWPEVVACARRPRLNLPAAC